MSGGAGEPGERGLTALATRRPVGVAMVALSLVVFGWISLSLLPRNLMPDISYPTITVRTEYPGAAPVDVEKRVSKRLEEMTAQVRNLRRIQSISRAGASDVILEFSWGTDMSLATSDVREKVAQAVLPDEAAKPTILRYDPTLDPIVQIGFYREPGFEGMNPAVAEDLQFDPAEGGGALGLTPQEYSLIHLRLVAEEKIERELESVPGVAAVRVRGGLEREIRVDVDEKRLRGYGLDLALVNQRLRDENLNQASGILYEGDQSRVVRTVNEYSRVDEIRDLILREGGGARVRLRDVARVTLGYEEPEVITRINGNPCVKLDIYKEADANLVDVARAVKEKIYGRSTERKALRELEERERRRSVASEDEGEKAASGTVVPDRPRFVTALIPGCFDPEDPFHESDRQDGRYRIRMMSDQSVFIERALDDVRSTVMVGGFLAILVLYLFLRNGWFTLTVGLSIPLSLVAAFIAMHLVGVSLNMMSLGGLALGIGMLVDNSIVVLESIFRCHEEGDPPRQAAIRGTRLVASAVTASTLTTVAVFFPIVFVEGIAGQVFRDQALTVVISLLASLATALYFIPAFVCRRLKTASARRADAEAKHPGVRLLSLRVRFSFVSEFPAKLASYPWRSALAPLAFLSAVLETFFLPIRVVFHVLSVGLTAVMLSGVLVYRTGGRALGAAAGHFSRQVFRRFDAAFDACRSGYLWLLTAALGNRVPVLLVVLLLAFVAFRLLVRLDSELIPEVHQGEFTVDVRLPRATRIERTDQVIRVWENQLLGARGIPGIESLTTTVGADKEDVNAGDDGPHTAKLLLRLERQGSPRSLEERVKEGIRRVLRDADFDSVEFRNPVLFSFKTPIEVEVKGYDLKKLRRVVDEIQQRMEQIPEIDDVKTNLVRGYPEVRVRFDPLALSRHDLRMADVGNAVRRKILGEVPTYFSMRDRKVPIRVRLREEHRYSTEQLENLVISPGATTELRLADVVRLDGERALSPYDLLPLDEGPSEIRRISHQRAAVVTANLSGLSLGAATEKVNDVLRSLDSLRGRDTREERVSVGFGGQKEEMDLALNSLRRALLLAVFLVFVVMAIQFESLVQPLVIIVAIPLAMVGVIPVLSVLDTPLSIVVFIGMIVLAGIVVNNAIVLVDTANRLHRAGLNVKDALLRAGDLRLRPILMTTATTVLGLLPLTGVLSGWSVLDRVLGSGEGAEIRGPLAVTVIAGLVSGTVLTLVVVPVMYSGVQSLLGWYRSRRGWSETATDGT